MSQDNVGIKISQPGWDVRTAGDANLAYSSFWPVIKIKDSQLVPVNGATPTIPHGLSYPPFAVAWSPEDGLIPLTVDSLNITLGITDVGSPSFVTQIPFTASVVRYYIFRVPLNKAYQSPIIKGALTPGGGSKQNYGIKYAKRGKSLNSKDLRDFTINSNSRSPFLHAVVNEPLGTISYGGSNQNGLVWNDDLPYRPIIFSYYSNDNSTFYPLSDISSVFPKSSYDAPSQDSYILNGSNTGGYGSMVILKDPFDSENFIQVTL